MLAIFLVRGARTQKKGLKTHLSKVSDDNAPRISHEQVRAAAICAHGSMAQVEFWTPLAFLPLSGGGGGGVRNRGRTSPTAQISAPGSTAIKVIPDPRCLSTFKQRGGSGIMDEAFRRPRSQCPNQRRSPDLIIFSYSVFSQCGPFPRHVIL
jgi:hypothetical protein